MRMGDDHLMSLQPGTVIAGRYEVVKCLGAGSMGLVYACRHRELSGHLVAIKVLFPEVAHDKVAAARFRNEIFASYGVSHPNVVRAYEYLRDGDLVAYTMEYVGGGDLADRLGKPGKLIGIEEILNLLSQMCAGVQAIHDAGIVHRDLKPENILLSTDGQVKIADFGIARTGHGPKLTEHGGVVGTIDYVSPEYMLNSHVDWRSDIYALGVLAYEMVTGEAPFRGDSVYATMTKRLKEDPAPPSTLRPECPEELDRIILKAMSRDPEQRYQSAAEVYYDLSGLNPGVATDLGRPEIKLSSSQATHYVGPTVAQRADSPTRPQMHSAVPEDDGPPSGHPEDSGRFRASTFGREASDRSSSGSVDDGAEGVWSDGASASGQAYSQANAFEGTRVLNQDLLKLASAFDDVSVQEPVKMERVLSRRSGSSGEWGRQELGPAPQIVKGGIDGSRIRTLSQSVERHTRPFWVDMVLVCLMVLIGLGVGFAILSVVLPSAFGARDLKIEQKQSTSELLQ
ncbi:MAG: serine/threonine protein kinase [Proteobacteria bacterium]|nr:serine/threonine protein kinase [Pseudomonadota bacterium]